GGGEARIVKRREDSGRIAEPRHAQTALETSQRLKLRRGSKAAGIDEHIDAITGQRPGQGRGIERADIAPFAESPGQTHILLTGLIAEAEAQHTDARAVMRLRNGSDSDSIIGVDESGNEIADHQLAAGAVLARGLRREAEPREPIARHAPDLAALDAEERRVSEASGGHDRIGRRGTDSIVVPLRSILALADRSQGTRIEAGKLGARPRNHVRK